MAAPGRGQSRAGTGGWSRTRARLGWTRAQQGVTGGGLGWKLAGRHVAKLELGFARAELDCAGAGLDWAELSLSRTGAVLRWIRAGFGARAGTEAVGQSRSWDRSRGRRTEQGFVGRIGVLRDEQGLCRTKQGPAG